jgi:hypothetical protein
MELNTLNGVLLVADALNDTRGAIRLGNPRSDLKFIGQGNMSTRKRMVTSDWYTLIEASKDTFGIMSQRRSLAMKPLPS